MSGPCDVLIYVQHLLGVGHLSRAALVARAVDRAGMSVTLVTGGLPVPDLDIGGATLVQLPPLRAADAAFSGLVTADGHPAGSDDLEQRRKQLLGVFHQARPKLVLMETFPFGRRQMRFELLPLLEAARARRPRPWIVSSVRDVLNPIERREKIDWVVDTASRHLDRVLVHGDPAFLPLEQSFPPAAQLGHLLDYTGYVVEPPAPVLPGEGNGEVLVSAGGGAVAAPLVDAALAAHGTTSLGAVPWRILLGHNFPESDFTAARSRAPMGVIVERARPDFRALLGRCRLSVSQGGYNTVMEVLAAGAPAVVVPFAAGGEREQTLRARVLEEHGLLTMVEERVPGGEPLAPRLAVALTKAEAAPKGGALPDMTGAETAAAKIAELVAILPP